jgi:hypothetical protein
LVSPKKSFSSARKIAQAPHVIENRLESVENLSPVTSDRRLQDKTSKAFMCEAIVAAGVNAKFRQ